MRTEARATDAATVTGALWLASMPLFLLLDPVRGWQTQEDFYRAVAASPYLYQLPRMVLGTAAFVGVAAVTEISRLFRGDRGAWLRWSSLLAVVALILTGVSQVRFALINPERAASYVQGDEATRLAVEATRFMLQLDPQSRMSSSFLMVWLVVVNRLAQATGTWSRGACVLGFAVVVVSLVGLSARALELVPVSQFTGLVNGFLTPAWFLWVGLDQHARRRA